MKNEQMCLVAIVIPMFNEEREANRCITTIMKYIKNIPSLHLLVVNDGSRDNTAEELSKSLRKHQHRFTVIEHAHNQGYGAAIKNGIQAARELNAEYVLFMDADLTNHPKYLKNFIGTIPFGYDCVKASRYIKTSYIVGVPFYRQFISYWGNIIAGLCFRLPIHDYTNGFRMIKTTQLAKIPYTSNDFSLLMEEMYWLKKMGASFYEIPYVLTSRIKSSSHFSYKPDVFKKYLLFSLKSCIN